MCHPYLVLHRKAYELTYDYSPIIKYRGEGATLGPGACGICYEAAEDAVISACERIKL